MQKQLGKKRGKREREEREKARHFRDRYRDLWLIAPEIRGWWLQGSSDWWWQRSPLVYNYYNQYVCILVCLQIRTHTHTAHKFRLRRNLPYDLLSNENTCIQSLHLVLTCGFTLESVLPIWSIIEMKMEYGFNLIKSLTWSHLMWSWLHAEHQWIKKTLWFNRTSGSRWTV